MLLSATAVAAQTTVPPAPGALTPAAYPLAQRLILPNGLQVLVLEQHGVPVVAIRLALPAGGAWDPQGREGVADLYAALITRGAGDRSAADVARAIEEVGGAFGAEAGPEDLTLQADVLSDHRDLGLELMADALLRPHLDPQSLELAKREAVASLNAGLDDAGALAARVFLIGAYGRHPYGRRPTPASVQAITRADLLQFAAARLKPAGALLVFAGDITLAEARRLAVERFGSWRGASPAGTIPPLVTTRPPAGIILVHQGGARTASILVGGPTFAGADTAYPAAQVMTEILGNGSSGRLARSFAEHGWSAATGSSFLQVTRQGVLQVTATVPAQVADSALQEIGRELEQLRTKPVTAVELDRARRLLSGSRALRIQTIADLATATMTARRLGLPATALANERQRLERVGAPSVQAVARRVLGRAGLTAVVVGDASRLFGPLGRLGTVRIFAADGRPLTLADVQPSSAPLRLVQDSVFEGPDSLVVLVQGQGVGFQVATRILRGDSLTYQETTSLGAALTQTTTVVLDTSGAMRAMAQLSRSRGQEARSDLRYLGPRIRGSTPRLTDAGPESVAIDTTLATPALDEGAVLAILPLLPLQLNTQWIIPVFSSQDRQVRRQTLTVADLTPVTIPAGTFECYRVDLAGGSGSISFFVTRSRPHRVVRIEPANASVELVAVNP
jgi:zinc protease